MVKSISDNTGARVNIPPFSLNKDEITIAGEKDGVAKAKTQIVKLYHELVSGSFVRCNPLALSQGVRGKFKILNEVILTWLNRVDLYSIPIFSYQ